MCCVQHILTEATIYPLSSQSFVTHIFFLDAIYDKSVESQVVARAYRMGATGPVHVEQLTAKNSVEEVMVELNTGRRQSKTMAKDEANSDPKEKHAKLHTLLKSAKLIRQVANQQMKRKADGTDLKKKKAAKTGVRFAD